MQALSKVFAIFLTAASLSFMAFAWALVQGGPNWQKLAEEPALKEQIAILPPTAPNGPYTATHRRSGTQLGSSPVLAEVVIAGQKRVVEDLRKQMQDLQQEADRLQAELNGVRQVNQQDQAGFESRAQAWSQHLTQLKTLIDATSTEITAASTELSREQKDLEERRNEVYRLRTQLDLLRTDLFAATVQRENLQDELLTLEETQRRLARRQAQLKQQLGGTSYEEPAAVQ